MCIKGGAPHVGAIHDVLYRDGIIATFADQVGQRLLQQVAGTLYPSVSLRHAASSDAQSYSPCGQSANGNVSEQFAQSVHKLPNPMFWLCRFSRETRYCAGNVSNYTERDKHVTN